VGYRPLPDILIRAPLLPVAALDKASRRLTAHPLGPAAIALASPALARAQAGPATAEARRALGRYARRTAFRPTPHGLLAGVAMGRLSAATRIATGQPRAHLTLSWARAAMMARALLDDVSVRAQARLRQTPSLLVAGESVRWLAMGEEAAEERVAARDATIDRLLGATEQWRDWAALRALAGGDEASADEWLLLLLDDGLLVDDLTPPLVGPPPLAWLRARLGAIPGAATVTGALEALASALDRGEIGAAQAALRVCPGGSPPGPDSTQDLHAVLVHQPPRAPTLARAAVERAAALAPLLFRLQEALAPPAAERLLQPRVGEALSAIVDGFGAGALEMAALAAGEYGVVLAGEESGDEADDAPGAPPRSLLAFLTDAVTAALAGGHAEVDLSSAELTARLDEIGPAPPPSAELFLVPSRPASAPRSPSRGRERPGAGWLLGLHAPAGATWGRFAHALEPALPAALARLADAESAASSGERAIDVAFAPSAKRADLCAHPPVRPAALALTGWPAAPARAIRPGDLALGADPSAPAPLSLRERESGDVVVPAPLARVRSAAAPAGLFRLLAGWSLYRQHAPWALALGPLGDLARVPRIAIDGFVVSPASWRVPAAIAAGAGRAAVARWRRAAAVPRVVQVGAQDELLPVDLDGPDAPVDLRGAGRVFEIWPPLAATADQDGRRVEAVVALCEDPDDEQRQRQAAAVAAARALGPVPPPRTTASAAAAAGWTTFKIFGLEEHQPRVLCAALAPAVRAALGDGSIDAWFFLPYVERPGPRAHLRVRVHGDGLAFARCIGGALAALRAAGAVTSLETAPYHPEEARLGGPAATAAAHAVYQSDSALALALLAAAGDADDDASQAIGWLVRGFDALAAGCGLDGDARWRLAQERRRAVSATRERDPERDADFRDHAPTLRAALVADDAAGDAAPADAVSAAFADHRRRVAAAVAPLSDPQRRHLLPTLLHLHAVRLAGPHREAEARATVYWERTREGLARGQRRSVTSASAPPSG